MFEFTTDAVENEVFNLKINQKNGVFVTHFSVYDFAYSSFGRCKRSGSKVKF